MKNLFIFLFGATCGAAGMFFYLRKDIKKKLDDMQANVVQNTVENGDQKKEDLPFEVKDEVPAAVAAEATTVNYNKIVDENGYRGNAPVPVTEGVMSGERINETDWGVVEIDMDTFMHDKSFEKERLVYFQGDRVLCNENGTIFPNPAELVGVMWEQGVGRFADNTSFIRNKRLVTDYEIYVENGLYTEEYGDENIFRED